MNLWVLFALGGVLLSLGQVLLAITVWRLWHVTLTARIEHKIIHDLMLGKGAADVAEVEKRMFDQ